MSLIATAIESVERFSVPDAVTRAGIALLVGKTRSRLRRIDTTREREFADEMRDYPIAVHADAANTQHYEVPAEFFTLVLGPRRKYSCCYYDACATTLAQAEERALAETVANAGLADGQRILELGCGWGSLSLYMAERFPRAHITAVSNSHSQRAFIESQAKKRGVRNLDVVTADMNAFAPQEQFDRVVSVEMFEHMANWRALLARVRDWLAPEGRLFIHVFTHRHAPYRFDHRDQSDWIAQHFFTGGIMPSHGLIRAFDDAFVVEQEWRWNGRHYRRTAEHWLENFDRNLTRIDPILESVYGRDAALWRRRWRLFFLATAGLFGHADGETWGVSHYRLAPTA